jgi:hypothetical protein
LNFFSRKSNDSFDEKFFRIYWIAKNHSLLTLNIFKRFDIDNIWLQEWDWFWKGLVNGFVTRVKLTWTLWTQGYIKTETTIAMNEQQALNYAETIKSAIQDVKDFKKP